MGIYFSPAAGVTLTNWSFENGKILTGPVWRDDRPTYYIFYSHGLSPSSWEFWDDIQFCREFHDFEMKMIDNNIFYLGCCQEGRFTLATLDYKS